MSLRNIVLALLLAGCGRSTTGSSGNYDGSLDCKVNCMTDGGNNKDGSSNDSCCNYSDGGKLDAGNYDSMNDTGVSDGSSDASMNDSYFDSGNYDGNINDGSADAGNYDSMNDTGVSDGSSDVSMNDGNNCNVDGSITYPRAVLTCSEWAEDCLCVHRPIKDQAYCWDASQSQAGPGRTLVEYRVYVFLNEDPNVYYWAYLPENLCAGYVISGTFLSKIMVVDDLGDSGEQKFYNIVND